MSTLEQINADMKTAMKAKEKTKLETLRAIKSALLLVASEKGNNGNVTDEAAEKAIQKLMKQRLESASIYKSQNRDDLAEQELEQANFMKPYLPEQLTEKEIEIEVSKIIEQVGASSATDFGKVMGASSKKLGSKADGKAISAVVKKLLS